MDSTICPYWAVISSFNISFYRVTMSIKPKYRPQIIKKRTKKFIRHQSDRYDKLKVSKKNIMWCFVWLCICNIIFRLSFCSPIGVNLRVLTTECEEGSRDSTWCPMLVTVATKEPDICCLLNSAKSLYTTLK